MKRAFEVGEDLSEIFEKCYEVRERPEAGCAILFLGFVKGISGGKKVKEYRVFQKEAELRRLEGICKEAEGKFPIIKAYVFRRFGNLKPGDLITAVLVISRGRREGFKAASWIVEKIKEGEEGRVEEVFENGATGGI